MPKENADKLAANVGRRIAELRLRAGETQARFAERVGVSVQYLSHVEIGANLTISSLARFANALGVTVADLLLPAGPGSEVRRGRPRKR